jgi:PAS domain S-box-containing protein
MQNSQPKTVDLFQDKNRGRILVASAALIIAVAITDWLIPPNVALGFLYIIPLTLAAGFLNRWQVVLLAAVCTGLREWLAPFTTTADLMARALLAMLAFSGVGLFVRELIRNREEVLTTLNALEKHATKRQEAEAHLDVLVDSSPLGILIVNAHGEVTLANGAAHRMLGFSEKGLSGQNIRNYLPVVASVQHTDGRERAFRTDVEAKGRRRNGELFMAHLWLSTFKVGRETRVAAIVTDTSDDLRDREESGLRQLSRQSKLAVGAVSHEVRTLCGAISMVHANLMRDTQLQQNEDFKALGSLLDALRSVASADLKVIQDGQWTAIDLDSLLDDVRIIIRPWFSELGATIEWKVANELPPVWAESQGLLQVFLNLCQNSHRALERASTKKLTISGMVEGDRVTIRIRDSGPGIRYPERLFQPFQDGAEITGLGLYITRAILRGFNGDLRYERESEGTCFAVELCRAVSREEI